MASITTDTVRFVVGTLLVICNLAQTYYNWTLPTYFATTATQLNACPKEVLEYSQRAANIMAVSFANGQTGRAQQLLVTRQ